LASIEAFADTGLPLSLLPSGQDGTTNYTVTRYRNTEGGYVKGLELSLQQQFTFLPGPFSNFGTLLNYTHVDSSVMYYLSSGLNAASVHDALANVSPSKRGYRLPIAMNTCSSCPSRPRYKIPTASTPPPTWTPRHLTS
jgi:iron complex outermembrane recepter protein